MMSFWKRILIAILVLILFLGVLFFALPPLLKPILMEKLSRTLNREVVITKITTNPFNLTASAEGVIVKDVNSSRTFASFDQLCVNIQGISSLFRRAVVLKEIRLVRPYIYIERNRDGSYNFSDLIPKEPKNEPTSQKTFPFSLNNIQIINGSIDFEDRPVGVRHTIRNIQLAVPFISDIGQEINSYVEPRFSATINGNPYMLFGKTKPFLSSRVTSFDLDMRDVNVPYYLNYVPLELNCKVKSAYLDTKLAIHFIMAQGKSPSIQVSGNIGLKQIELDDLQARPILKIPVITVALASFEPLVSNIHLSKVAVQTPEILIRRDQAGKINLTTLVYSEKPKQAPIESKEQPREKKKSSLLAMVDEFTMQGANITYLDMQTKKPVTVRMNPLDLTIKKIAMGKKSQEKGSMDLSVSINNKGLVTAKGPLALDPFYLDLAMDVKDLEIRPFQPYITDQAKVNVLRGIIRTGGRLTLDQNEKGKIRGNYTGKIAISDLASVDQAYSRSFAYWKQLYLEGVSVGFNPSHVNIKGISLADFYTRIIIHPDGVSNLQKIFSATEKAKDNAVHANATAGSIPSVKQKEEVKDIKIGRITLQGGTVDFMDQFIKPNYSAKMLNIGGGISGLSSQKITRASVDLRGNLGVGTPVEVTGNINPLAKELYTDIKMRFKNIELSPVTPYSNKYIGYPVVKGKLTFDVAYLISKQQLNARNNFTIDQLTLGERVNSPDAIKAPIPLALALLTDRNGRISLDVPVSGSLNDPKFKVWPIIWKVIGNLIDKAVMAPFSLLASLTGGNGEELSYVEFDAGSKLVGQANQKKIQLLANALAERPNLKLEIAGFTDSEKDVEGLKSNGLQAQIRAQKVKKLMNQDVADNRAHALERVVIEPQEYEKYLTLAYENGNFPKPRTAWGLLKKLPATEMEKLIKSHIEVTDNDLRRLAATRSEKVKEQLLNSGGVDSSRIFVVESRSVTPSRKDNVKNSRVEFKLK
jgi:flagellar motor protein MotB